MNKEGQVMKTVSETLSNTINPRNTDTSGTFGTRLNCKKNHRIFDNSVSTRTGRNFRTLTPFRSLIPQNS